MHSVSASPDAQVCHRFLCKLGGDSVTASDVPQCVHPDPLEDFWRTDGRQHPLRRRAERAVRLTLDWVDNAGGTANFSIERKTGTTGTYVRIATTSPGITTYVDSTVAAGTTYCYRVKASNALGDSGYSNETCKTAGN